MTDFSWLAHDAQRLHAYFQSLFYIILCALLVLGVFLEYFKLGLGQVPAFGVLVGRAFIAVLLLQSFPLVYQTLNQISLALFERLCDPSVFETARSKLADKLRDFSFSWVSIKESATVAIAYGCFAIFHLSIYVSDALQLYIFTLLYITSPVLIALYVLPATSTATTALYRSIIEVSMWRPVWGISATLLWSTALSDINKPKTDVTFLSVICYCLTLAGSLVLTPFVVRALAKAGMTQLAGNFATVSLGATAIGPGRVAAGVKRMTQASQIGPMSQVAGKRLYNSSLNSVSRVAEPIPKLGKFLRKVPRFNEEKSKPIFVKPKPNAPSNSSDTRRKPTSRPETELPKDRT